LRRQPHDLSGLDVDPRGLEGLCRLFQEMIDEGLHAGAQLAVFKNGRLIIELAGGAARPDGAPVTFETLFQIRSITKALAAMVMLGLRDQGAFDFDDPVSRHWPEFGRNGKAAITISHVLSHRAGIPDGPSVPPGLWNDRLAVARALEDMEPVWIPGSVNGYHAMSYGWVLDELVQRWTGRGISAGLGSALTAPLGIQDLFIGLPGYLYPRMAWMAVEKRVRKNQAARARFSDYLNTAEGIGLPLASGNGVGTARSLAELMNVLAFQGTFKRRTWLSEDTFQRAARPSNEPGVVDRRILWPVRWGLGFILGHTPHIYGRPVHLRSIGHAGGGANVAWADPEHRLAVAFLCNGMLGGFKDWDRYLRVGEQVYAAVRGQITS